MAYARRGLVGYALALLSGLLLSGCSTTDTFEQPAEVPDIESSVEFRRVWSLSVGDGHDGQFLQLRPLYSDGTIYASSADGWLTAVESGNGSVIWNRETGDRIFAGVGGDLRRLYYVTRDAELVAVSRETSEELWRTGLPTEVLAAPQSNGTLLVIQTTDGRVIGFDASSGNRLWQYDGQVPVLTMRTAAPPLVGGDIVIASFASGRLIALTTEAGQPVWQYEVGEPQGRTELERLVDIGGQPLVLDSAVMVAGYQGKLALVDIRSGQEIWSRKASSFYAPSIGGGNIFLAHSNGNIVAYRGSDRREIWLQDRLSWRQLTQPAVAGDYLVTGDFEGYLHVLNREDGSLSGQMKFDSDGIRVPVQALEDGSLLVFGNGGRMAVYKLVP